MEQYIRTNKFEDINLDIVDMDIDLGTEQYIRINEDGERVVDYKLLDIATYASLLIDVEDLAEDIDLDLDDADFSDVAADAISAMFDVEIEPDTKAILIEVLEEELMAKFENRNMKVEKLARLISELEAALPSHPELEDAVGELKDVLFDAESEPEILEGGESAVDEAEALLASIKG
jgi:hypothetical protein